MAGDSCSNQNSVTDEFASFALSVSHGKSPHLMKISFTPDDVSQFFIADSEHSPILIYEV